MRTSCHNSRANGICYQLELFVDRQENHAMRIEKVDSLVVFLRGGLDLGSLPIPVLHY